jgi:hypothetical protein
MGVAHLADQPVQGGDVALEIGMHLAADQVPVDSTECRDDRAKLWDVGCG